MIVDNTYPNPKYDPKYTGEGTLDPRDALNLVLLFYTVHWTSEKRTEWHRITGTTEASTKVMCDHIRAVLSENWPSDHVLRKHRHD
jgi:hypothetical protein